MSSATFFSGDDPSSMNGMQPSRQLGKVVLDNQLQVIKAITISLLTELESVRRSAAPAADEKLTLEDEVRRFESGLIRAALIEARGNQARAARTLGVKHTTLNAKIKRYGIQYADLSVIPPDATNEIAA